ncbi:MAG: response regulator [Chlorobi bacterium]|nr:response regulator [Chlorobiota bacterium]
MPTTILIVEDNPDNRLLIHMIFQRFVKDDVQLVDAGDGLEAVEYVSANTPDLILMDLKMPKMDGFEAIKKIRSIPSCKDVPILVLSAQANKADLERAQDIGSNGFITKPINIQHFIKIIQEYISIP